MDVICTVRECGSYHQRLGRQNVLKDLYKQKAKEIPRGITFPLNKQGWAFTSTQSTGKTAPTDNQHYKLLKDISLPKKIGSENFR